MKNCAGANADKVRIKKGKRRYPTIKEIIGYHGINEPGTKVYFTYKERFKCQKCGKIVTEINEDFSLNGIDVTEIQTGQQYEKLRNLKVLGFSYHMETVTIKKYNWTKGQICSSCRQ